MSRWIAVDPGETTGISVWEDDKLILATQIPLWRTADVVFASVGRPHDQRWVDANGDVAHFYNEVAGFDIDRIVCENWRIYASKAKALIGDECRTARLIGALTLVARVNEIPLVLQGADIKERALAGGAQEFFISPQHENRHANDSIMHAWFYVQLEMRDQLVPRPTYPQTVDHHPV